MKVIKKRYKNPHSHDFCQFLWECIWKFYRLKKFINKSKESLLSSIKNPHNPTKKQNQSHPFQPLIIKQNKKTTRHQYHAKQY